MKINLINPNTSLSMTGLIAASARAVAAPGTEIRAVSPAGGAPSIECHFEEAIAALGVVEEVRNGEAQGCDAHIIACFGDPGLDAAREVARGPVIGIAEAAMHAAMMLGTGFSVITTLSRTIVIAEHLARRYGAGHHCRRIRAVELAVLDLEHPHCQAFERILEEGRAALSADRSNALVLGCAGMSDLAARLSDALGVPVIDGVTVAVGFAETFVRCGLSTAMHGDYARPPAKALQGWAEAFSVRD